MTITITCVANKSKIYKAAFKDCVDFIITKYKIYTINIIYITDPTDFRRVKIYSIDNKYLIDSVNYKEDFISLQEHRDNLLNDILIN